MKSLVNACWRRFLLCVAGLAAALSASANGAALAIDWQSPLATDHPLVGAIYAKDTALSEQDLARRMAGARFLLIGEKHDNPDHQQLQVYLLQLLSRTLESGQSMSVVLEMLNRAQQQKVDTIAAQLAEDPGLELPADQLKSALDWPAQGWPWNDYAGVIGWLFNQRVALQAGNLDASRMRSVYRDGIGDEFISARALRNELQAPLLEQVYQGHCELMEKDSLSSMVDVQLVKDASMSAALSEAETSHSVLIAGTGHIRKDSAIPRHLRFGSGDPIVSLAMIEVDPERLAVQDYAEKADRFDIVIFTPVANQRDYCAELKKTMAGH